MSFSNEIKIECPQCHDLTASGNIDPVCSFNLTKRVWHCFRCQISGTESQLTKELDLEEIKKMEVIKKEPITLNHNKLLESIQDGSLVSVTSLPERFLDYTVPEGIFYKSSDGSTLVIVGRDWANQLRSIKYRKLVGEKAYWAEPGSEVGLFFLPAVENQIKIDRGEKSILITEGEIDAVTARLLGFNGDIVALQGTTVKDVLLDRLKYGYQSVYIATDNDAPGHKVAVYLVDQLPRPKVKRVNLPADCKDLNELLISRGKFEAEHLFRKEIEHDVYSKVHTIKTLSEVDLSSTEAESFSTGYHSIDHRLGGGLRRGELTIVHAKAKTGKTTFINQLLYQLTSAGVRTGIASFEMSIQTDLIPSLYSIALKQNIRELQRQKLLNGIDFSPLNKQLELISFYDHRLESCDLKSILRFVELCVQRNVKVVAIDHSLFLVKSAKESDEHVEIYRQLALAAVKYNIHIIIVAQAPKLVDGMKLGLDTPYGGVSASMFAFNFITLQRNADHENILEVRVIACRYPNSWPSYEPICLKYDRDSCSLIE